MKRTPSSEAAQKIAELFGRKISTSWSDKEIRRFRQLVKIGYCDSDELKMIVDYYHAERKKGTDGLHRRDLYTFLNNYSGEVDRARARQARLKRIDSSVPKRPRPPDLTEEQIAKNRAFVRQQIETLRAKMKMPNAQRIEIPPIVQEAITMFNGQLAQ